MFKYLFSIVLIINLCAMTSHGAARDTDDCFPGTSAPTPPSPSVRLQRGPIHSIGLPSAENTLTSGVKRKLGAALDSANIDTRPSAGKCSRKTGTDEDEDIAFMAASSTPHSEGESAHLPARPLLFIEIPDAVEKPKNTKGWFIEFQKMYQDEIEYVDRLATAGAGAGTPGRNPFVIDLKNGNKLGDISNFQSLIQGLQIFTTGVVTRVDIPWVLHIDLSNNPLRTMGLTLDPSNPRRAGLNAVLSYPDFSGKSLAEEVMLEPLMEVTLDLSSIAHKLQRLILKNCELNAFSIRSETLEVLDLSGNPLTSLDGIHAPELQSLKIDRTRMKPFDFRILFEKFPKLKSLIM